MTIDLFGNATPEPAPKKVPAKPVWSRVPRQRHEPCTPCTVELHEGWANKKPFVPAARAIYIRKEAGGTLYLCENHAAPLRAAENKERGKTNERNQRRRGGTWPHR